jgi:glutathione S-transferase
MGRTLAQWADTTLFWTAMAYNFQPAGAAQVFAGAPPEAAKAFAADRQAMRGGAARMPAADAMVAYKSYLRRLSDMLDDTPFLLGDKPSIADFSAYHPLWFTRNRTPALMGIFNATPAVLEWMDRMAAIGHSASEKFSALDAIAVAAAATPAPLHDDIFQDDHGIALGSPVTISSEGFGVEPTQGELVAATRMHMTLRRLDERAGLVHVHFPRIGYLLKAAVKAEVKVDV